MGGWPASQTSCRDLFRSVLDYALEYVCRISSGSGGRLAHRTDKCRHHSRSNLILICFVSETVFLKLSWRRSRDGAMTGETGIWPPVGDLAYVASVHSPFACDTLISSISSIIAVGSLGLFSASRQLRYRPACHFVFFSNCVVGWIEKNNCLATVWSTGLKRATF